ncbi:MAG TPA: Uma2 family endonuclease [Kofleriaceae bacterium]|jgi:Uma2 family endonuclease|nr:Uma2 family endonuclease [Kofleriaceae bacterium]
MVAPRRSPASYEDLLALPDNLVGELVAGELYASPRPAPRHAAATGAIFGELDGPFKRGRGGPGGWLILFEPELHLGDDALVPDLAGWRRTRMPEMPVDLPYFILAPDWVTEVSSPSTAALDRGPKLAAYAREHVPHVWIIDPIAQVLEVLELDGATYRIIMVASGEQRVRAVPFDAIELDLSVLWQR